MKQVNIILRTAFIICLPLFFLSVSLATAFNSPWLYQYGFVKYDVSSVTGISLSELNQAGHGLIRYFNSDEELIDLVVIKDGQPFTLFNEREVLHLLDVKELVQLDYVIVIVTGLFVLLYAAVLIVRNPSSWYQLPQNVIYGSILALLLIGSLGMIALIDFRWFFLQFHLISFANDLWLLNPATDYLIMMFPQGFWFDATFLCVGMTVFLAIAACTASAVLLRAKNRSNRT